MKSKIADEFAEMAGVVFMRRLTLAKVEAWGNSA